MFKHIKAISGFSTNDLAAAKKFYGELLGLEIIDKKIMIEVRVSPEAKIWIYEKPNHTPATYTVLNLLVPDIEKAVDELTALGVRFEQYDGDIKTDAKGINRNEMSLIAWFKDPAGNILSVVKDKGQKWKS